LEEDQMFRRLATTACAALLAWPLAAANAASAKAMSLAFSWVGIPACSSAPPAFKLVNAPAGTKFIDFELTDLDAPGFHHGGGVVAFNGGDVVPSASFAYTGPCPPGGGTHQYQWTATALDANKGELARATATRTFPSR
jgi:phosphatidylethanolamine-binding protein (PEBP) family uncharacterized protein